MIRPYFEKLQIYLHVYGLISYYWIKLNLTKWRFSKQEEKLIRLKFDVEKQWQFLPYLRKSKTRMTRKKLQAIEKLLQKEEIEMKNIKLDIFFIEDSIIKTIKIVKQK